MIQLFDSTVKANRIRDFNIFIHFFYFKKQTSILVMTLMKRNATPIHPSLPSVSIQNLRQSVIDCQNFEEGYQF